METKLLNAKGEEVGKISLKDEIFGVKPRKGLLHEFTTIYLQNQRLGTAHTKTRSDVSGGGHKPWKQKHTGRARAGSIRSPIWRKGGIVFGPHPREYRYELPTALRRSALVHSLRAKVGDQGVAVIESMDGVAPKTKALALLLKQTKGHGGTLLVVERPSPMLVRISRNIPKVAVRPASDLNCYEVLASRNLLVTSAALKQLAAAAEGVG